MGIFREKHGGARDPGLGVTRRPCHKSCLDALMFREKHGGVRDPWVGCNPASLPQTLYGCTHIHLNPCVLEWIGIKIYFKFHLNTLQHTWIKMNRSTSSKPTAGLCRGQGPSHAAVVDASKQTHSEELYYDIRPFIHVDIYLTYITNVYNNYYIRNILTKCSTFFPTILTLFIKRSGR